MLHMGVAEQGKLHAVDGDHATALLYYRRAMHMTMQDGDEEWFFRHYLDCMIESLELTGSFPEVMEYCDKAIALYGDNDPDDPLSVRDLAHLHQRRGIILTKMGELDAAKLALTEAMRLVRSQRQSLPLADRVLRWLSSGLQIDQRRLMDEQIRTIYFTVRHDNVDPERAVKLPPEMLSVSPFG